MIRRAAVNAGTKTGPDRRGRSTSVGAGRSVIRGKAAQVCRLATLLVAGLVSFCVLAACASSPEPGSSAPSGPSTPIVSPSASKSPMLPKPPQHRLVVAWQPSHQDDTGLNGWHEYKVCGDIVKRAMAALPQARNVLAWDTDHGLTGTNNYRPSPTNARAFDVEIDKANRAGADVFIAVHVNGGAPTSEFAETMPGDERSRAIAKRLVAALHAKTGMPDLGVIPMRLYSLEPSRNRAPIRILLEIGDNEADRAFLMDPAGRQAIAEALAGVVGKLRPGAE